jgi:ATP-dependent DNA helicase RecG
MQSSSPREPTVHGQSDRSARRDGQTRFLDLPVTALRGVGSRIAQKLGRLGVERTGDLLILLPQRYEDRTQISAIGTVRAGHKALVDGKIELAEVVFRRRRSLLVRLTDGTGAITLRFFHFSRLQQSRLKRGVRLRAFGEVRAGSTGLEMVHPELTFPESAEEAASATLTPIYPSTEGLHQQKIRQLVGQMLERVDNEPIEDSLAPYLDSDWPSIEDSLIQLHRPSRGADVGAMAAGMSRWQRRLALEELVAHRMSLKRSGAGGRRARALPLNDDVGALERFVESLPFPLTTAQSRVIGEIVGDIGSTRAMQRLLQGDVGSGKTVVASSVGLVAAVSGHQAAVMAPTELLAEQHFATIDAWLSPLGIRVEYLAGSLPPARRAQSLAAVAKGDAQIVVGTHALFQETVEFASLALVIVDEQHRFGVEQRLELMHKATRGEVTAHQLVMTATPIPRTLAMTAYADLDLSVIDELPAGRKPVVTVAMPERRRADLVRRISTHCTAGNQAYWVCPLIEESESLDSSAAEALERDLSESLSQLTVGLIHGRMRPADKDSVMRRFKDGEIDLLVATTVIEVGVDVPNATLMVVENAERMGLAQLHQLRGRVGRGGTASNCVLLYKPPLNDIARRRLEVMRETNDGFVIAQSDLELRGPGEVLGTRQTGEMRLRIADLIRDADLLPLVVKISDALLETEPRSAERLIRRWVRGGAEYSRV